MKSRFSNAEKNEKVIRVEGKRENECKAVNKRKESKGYKESLL